MAIFWQDTGPPLLGVTPILSAGEFLPSISLAGCFLDSANTGPIDRFAPLVDGFDDDSQLAQ